MTTSQLLFLWLLIFLDLLTLLFGRRLLFSFLLIKNNRKYAKKVHFDQNVKNRIFMGYIKCFLNDNKSLEYISDYKFYHSLYLIDLISLLPQYILFFTTICLNQFVSKMVALIFIIMKVVAFLIFRSQFDNLKRSKYERLNRK